VELVMSVVAGMVVAGMVVAGIVVPVPSVPELLPEPPSAVPPSSPQAVASKPTPKIKAIVCFIGAG
jgi:hypothetical protein